MKKTRPRSPSSAARRLIRSKTGGRCHVCGGPLGRDWHADHVRPHARGGKSLFENYLPCCSICNRARWKSGSKVIRRILKYGIVARKEVRARTRFGKKFLTRFREHESAKKSDGNETVLEPISRCVACLPIRLLVKFFRNGPPINTTISPHPALRFNRPPPRIRLPARPLCPSRFAPSVASPCSAPLPTTRVH